MAQVHQGILYRGLGKAQDAESCFRKAMEQGTPAEFSVPEARACFGSALLELGDAAAAEPLLREAANANGTRTSDIAARLQGLRQLAIIENQRGHNVTALALLHRAQGVADGRIPDNNTFWPSLFDQRGWMHYQVQNYQTALLDFTAAINSTQAAQLLMQPQEGAARCYLELAKADQAHPLLENCLKLRNQFAPEDKPALGRINLLLADI
jgi:tetratricopeptide (TPR) repeat protein